MCYLTHEERALLRACVDVYLAEIRQACLEDQGTANGEPGTLGHNMQVRLLSLLPKLRSL